MTEPLTLDRYYGTQRLSSLKQSPGSRSLVVAVARLGPEDNEFRTALLQADLSGKERRAA